MQIVFGDYDPLVHVAGFAKLEELLPAQLCGEDFIEEEIYVAYRKLKANSLSLPLSTHPLNLQVKQAHLACTLCLGLFFGQSIVSLHSEF